MHVQHIKTSQCCCYSWTGEEWVKTEEELYVKNGGVVVPADGEATGGDRRRVCDGRFARRRRSLPVVRQHRSSAGTRQSSQRSNQEASQEASRWLTTLLPCWKWFEFGFSFSLSVSGFRFCSICNEILSETL